MEIKNLERIMQKVLNFCCKIVIDPGFDEINKIIKETADLRNKNSDSYYCFTGFKTSHGNQVSIFIYIYTTVLDIMHV